MFSLPLVKLDQQMHNRTEYLPNPHESEASNGYPNGQAKIFSLKPATDPSTLAILESRNRALADETLTRSIKAAFCFILDRSLDPAFFDHGQRGVVTISDTVIAEVFGVSKRTVFTWKRRLEDCGYVWLTRRPKSNMWPITTYHLSCLHKPRREAKTDSDGTYGSGKFRSAPAVTPPRRQEARATASDAPRKSADAPRGEK